MNYVGIDPGKQGGVVVLNEDGIVQTWFRMPLIGKGKRQRVDVRALCSKVTAHIGTSAVGAHVGIELVGAMPGQGVTSMFSFGHATGSIYGMVEARGWMLSEVQPKDWQREHGVNSSGAKSPADKQRALKANAAKVATGLWPELGSDLRVKANWGVADAALIAEFLRRRQQGRRTL